MRLLFLLLCVFAPFSADPVFAGDTLDPVAEKVVRQIKRQGARKMECRSNEDLPWKWRYRAYRPQVSFALVVMSDNCTSKTQRRLGVHGNGSHRLLPKGQSFTREGVNFTVNTWSNSRLSRLNVYAPPFWNRYDSTNCEWVQCMFELPAGLKYLNFQFED